MHRVLFSFCPILRLHSFVLRFRDTEITSSKLSVLKELCIALLFSVWKTWCQRIIFTENAFTRNCKFIKFAKEISLRILLKLSGLKAKILLPHSFKPRKKVLGQRFRIRFCYTRFNVVRRKKVFLKNSNMNDAHGNQAQTILRSQPIYYSKINMSF